MSGLLSLKWNNHSTAFLNTVSNIRKKDQFCDATIICHGRYYPVHKFVLSTCSEYFEDIFEKIDSKNPIIIIKDIDPKELELLLNYMYEGEVNVLQDLLPGLIKSAEALKVRGLAVPDDEDKNVSKNFTHGNSRGKRYRTFSPISLNKRPRNTRRSEEVLQSSNDIQEDFNEINRDQDILSIKKKLDCTDVSLEGTNKRKIAVGDEKSNNTKCNNDTLHEQEQFSKSKLSDIKLEVEEESHENYEISFSECVNFKDENDIISEDEDSLTSQQGIPQCSTWNEIEPPSDGDCLSGLDERTDEIDCLFKLRNFSRQEKNIRDFKTTTGESKFFMDGTYAKFSYWFSQLLYEEYVMFISVERFLINSQSQCKQVLSSAHKMSGLLLSHKGK